MNKRIGVVLRFGIRGFGFLQDVESRKEYFVHIDDVIGRIALMTGQRVEFQEGPAPRPGKAQQAILVDIIETAPVSSEVRQ